VTKLKLWAERLYVSALAAPPLDPDDAILRRAWLSEGPDEPRPLQAAARDAERITTQQPARNRGNLLSGRMPDVPMDPFRRPSESPTPADSSHVTRPFILYAVLPIHQIMVGHERPNLHRDTRNSNEILR
jgi:hypothetical protein